MFMKSILTAGAMALFATAASAVTFLDASDANENGGVVLDVNADVYQFQDTFAESVYTSGGNTLTFTFLNTKPVGTSIVVSSATILQAGGGIFLGGASVDWTGGIGNVVSAGQGATASGTLTFNLAGSTSADLVLSFGEVQEFKGAQPDIDFFVSTIPLPAGALLMGTALAGFGVAARRKRKS